MHCIDVGKRLHHRGLSALRCGLLELTANSCRTALPEDISESSSSSTLAGFADYLHQ